MVRSFVRRAGVVLVAALAAAVPAVAGARTRPAKIRVDRDQVITIDGRRVFPLGFTLAPPPGSKTPEGQDGLQELADAGALLVGRSGPVHPRETWDDAVLAREIEWQKMAAAHGLYCCPWLKELASIEPGDAERTARLESRP